MTDSRRIRITGTVFLTLTALAQLLVALSYGRGVSVMTHYIGPLCFAFAGMTLLTGRYGRQKDLYIGLAFMGWFVISRILLKELYLDYSYAPLCNLASAYLLALPFAHTAADTQKKRGLTAVAVITLAGYGSLAWLSVLAAVSGQPISLPYLGTVVELSQSDLRLYANTHPNISACLFMLALMLGLWLAAQYKRRWLWAALLVLGAGAYIGIAFTVSRTVMIQVGVLAGALVFAGCLRLPMQAAWKRWVLGLAAALVCLVGIFLSFEWVANGTLRLFQSMSALAEETAQTIEVANRSILNDLATMTGRTEHYQNILKMLWEDPAKLVTGLLNSSLAGTIQKITGTHHAHNAFLQTLVNMGIPALLMAVWFAVRAVYTSLRLLLSRKASFADQVLAASLLALLVGSISEPYLFTEYLTACNFPFFLLLGYVLETERALKAE